MSRYQAWNYTLHNIIKNVAKLAEHAYATVCWPYQTEHAGKGQGRRMGVQLKSISSSTAAVQQWLATVGAGAVARLASSHPLALPQLQRDNIYSNFCVSLPTPLSLTVE